MNYKLTIFPAIEASRVSKEYLFKTLEEMKASKDTTASMLLFLQDDLQCMGDYSNVFIEEVYEDGEWVDIEESEFLIDKLIELEKDLDHE